MTLDPLIGWFDDRAAAHAFSGVALVWRDGAPLFAHAAGLAHRGHGVPNRVQTRFAVGSVTKLVTAVTALRLVDRGLLDLHAPVRDVLPEHQRPAALTERHTLHHLLSHTSGLGNYHDTESLTWDSFLACWDTIATYRLRGPADLAPLYLDAPPVAEPGVRFSYADANFQLVGLMIEAATGLPFGRVAAQEVLVPAGLADTEFAQLDDEPVRLATGYLATDATAPDCWRSAVFSVPIGGMPDGSMITTATDLARLLDAIEAGSLLPARLLAAMTSPQDPDPAPDPGPSPDRSAPAPAAPVAQIGVERYGYGCDLAVQAGAVTVIGHAGMDPGVDAEAWHYRTPGITLVVLCNHDRGADAALRQLAAAFDVDDPRT